MDSIVFPAPSHLRVPPEIGAKGPYEATGATVRQNLLAEEGENLSSAARLVNVLDSAYRYFSHLDLLTGSAWLERVVGWQAFGAFVILPPVESRHNKGCV